MVQNFPHRRTIRLTGYDYSQEGLYFVTICCQDRICRFGKIVNGEMILNEAGRMIDNQWNLLKERFTHIELHDYIIMPNHFHSIIEINQNDNVGIPLVGIHNETGLNGQPQGYAPTTIGQIVGAFKSITTNKYIEGVEKYNWEYFDLRLWQRNYYEHIIRNSQSFQNMSDYIINNPHNWADDEYYNQ